MNAATSHPLNHAEWYILIAAAVFTVTFAAVFLTGVAVVHITEDRAEASSAQAGTAPNHVPAIPPASLAAHQDAGGTQTRKPVGVEETPAGFRHHTAAGGAR